MGPRFAQPEDRLRGCLEGRTALIQLIAISFTDSFAGITNNLLKLHDSLRARP
jgi:hypothetical protein